MKGGTAMKRKTAYVLIFAAIFALVCLCGWVPAVAKAAENFLCDPQRLLFAKFVLALAAAAVSAVICGKILGKREENGV